MPMCANSCDVVSSTCKKLSGPLLEILTPLAGVSLISVRQSRIKG